MKKGLALITGGTGMVGMHLLLHLIKSGDSVRSLKRSTSDLNLVKEVFSFYKSETLFSQIEWIEGDIKDIISLSEAMIGIDTVYHTAALVSFDPKDRERLYKNNIEGTENVVNACLENNITKLCHVSSTAAIGASLNGEVSTENNQWKEEKVSSNYAISKHYAENEIWRGVAEGLSAIIVNPSIIIGPGDINRSSGRIYQSIKNGLRFYTSGSNAFVDVRDVADAMILLMNKPIESERFLLIGENLTYKSLFNKVAQSLYLKSPTIFITDFMVKIAWRVAKLNAWFTRKSPIITAESAKSSINTNTYSAKKIHDTIGFNFRSIDEAVENAGRFFK